MSRQKGDGQVDRLIDALKWLFRSRGLRYADIATALGLSRTTLKRRLTGYGLTVDLLESLCGLVGIGLAELFDLANANEDPRLRRLTPQQEGALLSDGPLGFIFGRIREGWSARELQEECHIPEARLVGYLVRLEKLGLIDLLPGNRIRLRTSRDIDWRKHGHMWHALNRHMKDIFRMTDPDDTESSRRIAIVKLSPASVAQIDDMFESVQSEIRRLAHNDRTVASDDKVWYAVLLGGRPFEMDFNRTDPLPWRRLSAEPATGADPAVRKPARAQNASDWQSDRRTVVKRHTLAPPR